MTNIAISYLDDELLKFNPTYPIYGSFLEKSNFITLNMSKIEKEFGANDLDALHKELEDMWVRAKAESPRRIGRLIQHIFSFYPYER